MSPVIMSSPSFVRSEPAYDRAVRTLRDFHDDRHNLRGARFDLEAIDESSEQSPSRNRFHHDLRKTQTCCSLSELSNTEISEPAALQRTVRHSSPQIYGRMKRLQRGGVGEEPQSTANASWGFYQAVDSDAVPPNPFMTTSNSKPQMLSAFARPHSPRKSTRTQQSYRSTPRHTVSPPPPRPYANDGHFLAVLEQQEKRRESH